MDQNGLLCKAEVRSAMEMHGLPCSNRDVDTLFARADADADGHISTTEFAAFCSAQERQLQRVYRAIDVDGDGLLSSADIRRAASDLGFKVSHAQLRSFMAHVDANADGFVCFDELRVFLLLLPDVNPAAIFETIGASLVIDHAEGSYSPPSERDRASAPLLASLANKLYAGGVAGAVSRTVTAPIDRVKLQMQAAPAAQAGGGMLSSFRAIYADGGALALFRGNSANVVKIAPETAVKFIAFDALKRAFAADADNATVAERFTAGGVAGAIAQVVVYPLEICKTRLALSPQGTYMGGVAGCLRAIARAEGVGALYQGLSASLMGIMPYAGIDLAVNSLLKERVASAYAMRGQEPAVSAVLTCGMLSSSVAMVITYPLNLVRTRLQASGMPGSPCFDGPIDCLQQTVRGGGLRALYAGLLPNMLKVLPATSISYAMYDKLAAPLAAAQSR